jgi:hypothetical protein
MSDHKLPRDWVTVALRELEKHRDDALAFPVGADFIAAYREVTDKIGPRHRLANRWHFDLGWEFAPGVMAAWLTPEVKHGR